MSPVIWPNVSIKTTFVIACSLGLDPMNFSPTCSKVPSIELPSITCNSS